MEKSDIRWSVGKCYRVIRPLKSQLSKYSGLARMYPSLVEFPCTETEHDTASRQGSSRPLRKAALKHYFNSSNEIRHDSPMHISEDVESWKNEADYNRVFGYYKTYGSDEAYCCLLSIFNIFQQFMEIAYQGPLTSLSRKAAFKVGNCIASTDDDIPQNKWYEGTDMIPYYQRIICLGHGVGLILKNSYSLRHVLPAFVHECHLRGWAWVGDIIFQEYLSILSTDEFWGKCHLLNSMASVCSPTMKTVLLRHIPAHSSEASTTHLSRLSEFFDTIKSIDLDSIEALEEVILYSINFILGALKSLKRRNKLDPLECNTTITGIIRRRFSLSKNDKALLPKPHFVNKLLQSIPISKSFADLRLLLTIFASHSECNYDTIPLTSSKPFSQLLCAFFPAFDLFKSVVEFILKTSPVMAINIASYYISNIRRDLEVIMWQDSLETKASQLNTSLTYIPLEKKKSANNKGKPVVSRRVSFEAAISRSKSNPFTSISISRKYSIFLDSDLTTWAADTVQDVDTRFMPANFLGRKRPPVILPDVDPPLNESDSTYEDTTSQESSNQDFDESSDIDKSFESNDGHCLGRSIPVRVISKCNSPMPTKQISDILAWTRGMDPDDIFFELYASQLNTTVLQSILQKPVSKRPSADLPIACRKKRRVCASPGAKLQAFATAIS